jgi:type I restriction enzyme S subunit
MCRRKRCSSYPAPQWVQILYLLFHEISKRLFDKFEAEGTVFGSINKSDFENLPFIAPSSDVLELFDRIVSAIDCRIKTNECESNNLAAIRDALLPKLISGELRVPDAERIAGRCAWW